MTLTKHATIRSQQRGIPPLISQWLLDYGVEQYGRGGVVIRYFSSTCVRQLERDVGREPVKRMHEFLRCYLVQDSSSGSVITVGKRYPSKHVWKH